jgi:transcriptional regulator with XRE-family HTH domain
MNGNHMNRTEIGQRIRSIRQSRNIGRKVVASALRADVSYITKIEKGGANFTINKLLKIAESLNVETYQFFSDVPLVPATRKDPTLQFNMPHAEIEGIKCFDSPLCLGPGFNMDDAQLVGYLPISKTELPIGYKSEPDRIVCFPTTGDSMMPTIMPDSHIVIDRYVPAEWITSGGLYAFLLPNEDVTIKRLIKIMHDSVIIDGDNKDEVARKTGSVRNFPTVLGLRDDESIFRGRVIWILNRFVPKE